jgi:Rieske Fe-S protein
MHPTDNEKPRDRNCGRSGCCTRRALLTSAGAVAFPLIAGGTLLLGCAAERLESPDPMPSDAVTITDTEVRLALRQLDALRTPQTAYVVASVNIIVLRTSAREFRAFSNVCTHAGCGIYVYRDGRMVCQCHGSEFDLTGRNVAGPADAPLMRYDTVFDEARQILVVARS